MTTIRYFIPEDGDLEVQPNVFLAPKPRQQGYSPTLAQVKTSFPLPGRYHFRFKSPIVPGGDRETKSMPVWMDAVDDRQPVPTWRGAVVAKVTRIGVEDDDDDDDEDFRRSAPAAAPTPAPRAAPVAQQAPPPQQQQHQQQPDLDLFGGGTPTPPPPSSSMPNSTHSSTADLFDSEPAPTTANGSLLDMDAPYGNHQQQQAKNHAHSDFLGMTATPSPPVSGNYGGPPPQQQRHAQSMPPQRPPPQQQPNNFNNNNNFHSQGPFGGLGTPWKN